MTRAPYPDLLDRALMMAAEAHHGQLRRHPTRQIPYFAHCAAVSAILLQAGFAPEVAAAGALHDTLEDTPLDAEALRAAFGPEVARWVDFVTEQDKSLAWEPRKEAYLRRLGQAPIEAVAVAAADKLHNARALLHALHDLAEAGLPASRAFASFKRGPRASLDFLRRAHALMGERVSQEPRLGDLLELLADTLDELDAQLDRHPDLQG